jgi:hypothetical protein
LTVAGQAERFELPGTDLQMGILLRSMTLRIICRTISQMLKNWSG